MKKLALIFALVIGVIAFAQKTQSEVETIAKDYFEKEYVQKTFKDPYSYELKKIWSEPITNEMYYSDKISEEIYFPKNKSEERKQIQPGMSNMEYYIDKLNKLSKEDLNKIVGYKVSLDTYGANSYGNKILGRYYMKVSTDGEIIAYPKEREN